MFSVIGLGGKNTLLDKVFWPSLYCSITGGLRCVDLGESSPLFRALMYVSQGLKCNREATERWK